MNAAFSSMHGRVLSHSTEQLDRVEKAISEVFVDCALERKRALGHHGNEIIVIETSSTSRDCAVALLRRLPSHELDLVARTLDARIDDSCNLFLRIDKQRAFLGEIVLASNDDAVAVRMKVRAFPARKERAVSVVSELLAEIAKSAQPDCPTRDSFK